MPFILLGLIASGSHYGYDIKRLHDIRFPQARPAAFGQVYATLDRLERDGLVAVAGIERADGPDRTRYLLTAEGGTHLADWLATAEPPAPFVNNTLFTKVVLALLTGGSAAAYLTIQRAAHLDRMRQLTRLKTDATATMSDVVSADFAIAHLDADLRWMELTAQRLDMLREEIQS